MALAALCAEKQFGLITRRQAITLAGETRLKRWIAEGRVVAILPAVFAFPGSVKTWDRALAAVVLWYGGAQRRSSPGADTESPGSPDDRAGISKPAADASEAAGLEPDLPRRSGTEHDTLGDTEPGRVLVLEPPPRRAAISHHTAAELWKLGGIPEMDGIDVIREGRRCPPPDGTIRTHESELLPETDVTTREGLVVTTPMRTIMDLAALVTPHELELAILDAIENGYFTPDDLRERVASEQKRKLAGLAALEFVFQRAGFDVVTESPLEREALQVLLDAGLRPAGQHDLLRVPGDVFVGRYDQVFPREKVLIEVDSRRWHRAWKNLRRDGEKTEEAVALGYEVVRVRKRDLHGARRRQFLRQVREALATAPIRAAMKWPASRLRRVPRKTPKTAKIPKSASAA